MARLIAACALWMLISAGAAFSAGIEVKQGAPEGFDALAQPRLMVVSVQYGGRLLGQYTAFSSPDALRFKEPRKLAEAIPALKDKALVLRALSWPLNPHPGLLCGVKKPEGCGRMQPDIAGVIFDESHLSAELFVNPRYLEVTGGDEARYLPLPQSRAPATVAGFSGAFSGQNAHAPSYALTSDMVASYGEMQGNAVTTLADRGLRFDSLSAGRERLGVNEEAGLIRSTGSILLGDRDLAGARVSTSMRTRLDEYKSEGNPIILYLPRRAIVSLYREGRLYSARSYEAGNQKIDTRELPDGAYVITLRIQEADGLPREETRFFARMQNLPPADAPYYYAQAGLIRSDAAMDGALPHLGGQMLAGAGMTRRIGEATGISLNLSGLNDRVLTEATLFRLGHNTQTSATLLGSTKGDQGFALTWIGHADQWSAGLDARSVFTEHTPLPGFQEQAQRRLQLSGTLSYSASPRWMLGLKASYASTDNAPLAASIGPYAQWRIWQTGEDMLSVDMSEARTEAGGQAGNQASVMAHFSHRMGHYGVTGSMGLASSAGDSGGPSSDLHLWRETQGDNSHLLASGSLSADRRQRTLGTDADWQNALGRFYGSAQQSVGQVGGFGYGGGFSVNAAGSGGSVEWGGLQNDKSAILVALTGESAIPMRIYVDGSPRGVIESGERKILYLTPFRIYRVRIAPVKPAMIDYDNAEKSVTLYPGNVAKLAWSIRKFHLLAARIVNADGSPLSGAPLEGAREAAQTDPNGYLQTEIVSLAPLVFTTPDRRACRVALPPLAPSPDGLLIYQKPLVCTVAETSVKFSMGR